MKPQTKVVILSFALIIQLFGVALAASIIAHGYTKIGTLLLIVSILVVILNLKDTEKYENERG